MPGYIIIKGAKVHNLKNINLKIPRDKLIVITGVSGSGKSSLAFDTLYAEGKRRYVESLSSYARQFLGLSEKPEVDSITGLSPAVSIDQKTKSHNPRSTVGTVTEIYDYLRLLFARIGKPYCPKCGRPVNKQSIDQIVKQIFDLIQNKTSSDYLAKTDIYNKKNKQLNNAKHSLVLFILAPIIKNKKGEHKQTLAEIRKAGFVRVRLDGCLMNIEEAEDKNLNPKKRHNIEILVDRLLFDYNNLKKGQKNSNQSTESLINKITNNSGGNKKIFWQNNNRSRLVDSLEKALEFGNGLIIINFPNFNQEFIFSQNFSCPYCNISISEIEPRNFSFNSPYGACPVCTGLGLKREISPDLILNLELSINEGAIRPWFSTASAQGWYMNILKELSQKYFFSLNKPLKKFSKEQINLILYGQSQKAKDLSFKFEGVIPNLEKRYLESQSDYIRGEIEKYMVARNCPECQGKRLRRDSLAVKIADFSIAQIAELTIKSAYDFFNLLEQNKIKMFIGKGENNSLSLNLDSKSGSENMQKYLQDAPLSLSQQKIASPIFKEIKERLKFLINVGLSYLTLDRSSNSLSGGESQRIRLATQIGSGLCGVLYILDEPTIGLHPYDNTRLINTLKELRDLGNTVIVVEHDRGTIESADWLIDIGPGAGDLGGQVLFSGNRKQIHKALKKSLTVQYLLDKKKIEIPSKYRQGNKKFLEIQGAAEHNLKNIDVKIPLAKFVCITGVSGSGKSTLVSDILSRALRQKFYQTKETAGKHKRILGLENLDKIIEIDQSPIGRTPRSNPATYIGVFTLIRDLFAKLPEARIRGYRSGRFSFNVKGGRCETCRGDGLIKIEMYFLPDVYVECEYCKGRRYNRETLEVHYKGKNIADILNMNVIQAKSFFNAVPQIRNKLKVLDEVGLSYIKLGQAATTLSGGEAQRVKLSAELSRRSTGKTLYILDEPTTGLHFNDVKKLLAVLNKLTDRGNTVLLIEHNLDLIKCADWIIDLGPGAGEEGGFIVAEGTPQDIANCQKSYTGQALKKILENGNKIS